MSIKHDCIVPGELSPAAANPERLRRERTCVLKTSVGNKNSIFSFLQIMDFEKIREKVEKQQDESEAPLSQLNGWKISNEKQMGKLTEHARQCPRNVRVFCGKKKC